MMHQTFTEIHEVLARQRTDVKLQMKWKISPNRDSSLEVSNLEYQTLYAKKHNAS